MAKVSEEYIQNKKSMIVRAAYDLCLQKTIGTVTMQDIINATGLSQGGIYRFYKDIDEIFRDMLIDNRQRVNIKVIESFKKHFLPEKYLDSYLRIADFMTDQSLENIVHVAFAGGMRKDVKNRSRILFIHGTRGNEILSKRAAALMKKYYPETKVICFNGDLHCYKVIYEPERWIQVVDNFLSI